MNKGAFHQEDVTILKLSGWHMPCARYRDFKDEKNTPTSPLKSPEHVGSDEPVNKQSWPH